MRAGVTSHRLLDRSTVNPSGFHCFYFFRFGFSYFLHLYFVCRIRDRWHVLLARSVYSERQRQRQRTQPKPNDHIINLNPSHLIFDQNFPLVILNVFSVFTFALLCFRNQTKKNPIGSLSSPAAVAASSSSYAILSTWTQSRTNCWVCNL